MGIFLKYSVKRKGLLEDNITQICFKTSKNKLVNFCKARWVARHDAFEYSSNCIQHTFILLVICFN